MRDWIKRRKEEGIRVLIFSAFLCMLLLISGRNVQAVTAKEAFDQYKSYLASQTISNGEFSVVYLNNNAVPDLIYRYKSGSNYFNRFMVDGGQVYYTGRLTMVSMNNIYYYQKKSLLFSDFGGSGSVQRRFYRLYTKSGKNDLVPYLDKGNDGYFWEWYTTSKSNDTYDSVLGLYIAKKVITASGYSSLVTNSSQGAAAAGAVFRSNTAANRNSYLKAGQKSQTIRAEDTYKAAYKKNGTFSLNAKASTSMTYKSSKTSVATVSSSGIVTIKGYGTTVITITAKSTGTYKSAKKQVTVQIIPKKQTISSLKSASKKTFTVAWTKDSTADGYQIDYSTSSSFSGGKRVTINGNSTVSRTIDTGKEGKKYYVRVRSFKKVSGSTLYGYFSAVKNITVKAGQSITVNSTFTLEKGKTKGMGASAKGKLTYSSRNKNVATISSGGVLTAVGAGTAIIDIKAAATGNYVSSSKSVTVTVIPEKVVIRSLRYEGGYRIKIEWNNSSNAQQYQLRVSNVSTMKNAENGTFTDLVSTDRTFTKRTNLPPAFRKNGITVYVQIRALKTVQGKLYQGAWSDVKAVRVG